MSTLYAFELPIWSWIVFGVYSLIGYLVVCFLSWYAIQALNYGLNSGQLGRHWLLFPFQCFLEDLRCYLPSGKVHREAFIRDRVRDWDGIMIGRSRSYDHKEIRQNNLYEEVFYEMRGGGLGFWLSNIVYFFFGPLAIAFFIALILVSWVLHFLGMLFPEKLKEKLGF